MKFELGKKARNTGIRDYIISIIAILICIDVSTVMLMRNDFSYFILTVTWLLALPISIILFKSGLKYLTSDGKWKVTVDDFTINWETPKEDNEAEPFSYKLADKDFTRTRQIYTPGGSKASWDYDLIFKGGERQALLQHAGINVRKVIKALEKNCIENQFERIDRKKLKKEKQKAKLKNKDKKNKSRPKL